MESKEQKENILSSFHITLDNKDYTYEQIFANYRTTNLGNLIISLEPLGRYFKLIDKNERYYFFCNPLSIKILKKDAPIKSHKDIYSYEQIKELIDENDFDNAYIKKENNQYLKLNALNVTKMVNNNIYDFMIEIVAVEEINNKPFLIEKGKKFKPKELTSKFYDYFKYNKEETQENDFDFIINKEREKLFSLLNDFTNDDSIYIFKITGPSNNGKSTTLLFYSRTQTNAFYFNLSYLMKRELNKDYIKIFDTIYEEMKRLYLPSNSNKNEIYQILQEQKGNKTWEIISFLVNHLNKKKDINYIFIFDQFKSANVDKKIYNSLLEKIKDSKIKFIICSSINDLDIKLEYKKTILHFKGNPESLCVNTQEFYFYFTFLYKPIYETQDKYYPLLKLFNFLQKYQNIFKNCKIENIRKEINTIDERIELKLKDYESSSLFINYQEYNLYEALMNILLNLNKDIEYKELIRFYDILPLKYFYFEFKPSYFQMHYLFEYIVIFIKKKYSNADYKAFFEKIDMGKEIEKKDSKIIGEYFEKSVINSIKDNKIVFENKCEITIKLNEICSMDYEVKDKLEEALKIIINDDNSKIIDDNLINDNREENKISEIENKHKEDENKDIKESKRLSDIIDRRLEKVETIITQNYKSKYKDLLPFLSEKSYKENILDINDFKKYLDLFERIDDKKRTRIDNYKNNSILIEQDKINGRCIDMAMIWTNQQQKNIFIGFQIKCFKELTSGGNASKISKMRIKCNYIDILLNSKDLLGITIDEWHYVMILYCSHKKQNTNEICSFLVTKCKTNRIKYIFYDPLKELFYDKDLKEIKGVFNLLDVNSNLDYGNNFSISDNNLNKSAGIDFLGKKYKLSSADLIKENKEDIESFRNFLQKLNTSFIQLKRNLMELFKDIDKIRFIEKISTIKLELLTPNIGSLFCYKGKNKDILIIIKRNDELGVEYYNLNKKKSYNIFWEFGLDLEEIQYFYVLNFEKKEQSKEKIEIKNI